MTIIVFEDKKFVTQTTDTKDKKMVLVFKIFSTFLTQNGKLDQSRNDKISRMKSYLRMKM